jgi:hypothetical protein
MQEPNLSSILKPDAILFCCNCSNRCLEHYDIYQSSFLRFISRKLHRFGFELNVQSSSRQYILDIQFFPVFKNPHFLEYPESFHDNLCNVTKKKNKKENRQSKNDGCLGCEPLNNVTIAVKKNCHYSSGSSYCLVFHLFFLRFLLGFYQFPPLIC